MQNNLQKIIPILLVFFGFSAHAQNPSAFACTNNDGFGYYISSASSNQSGGSLTYSNSRLSKITTSTGARTTLCTEAQMGRSMNALAFNPYDNFLYAVSRFDPVAFSGTLYRIGENCQKLVIPVSGAIVKYATNNTATTDAGGGTIVSGTFDLDNNYYVNTAFVNSGSTGFTNKIQVIKITGNTATVVSTRTLTCPTCTTTTKMHIADIIYDAATNKLYGTNSQTNKLYQINAATGVISPVGNTGVTNPILGIYKNVFGDIRAIDNTGRIYSVNVTTAAFTFLTLASLNSSNADAASGCYNPPSISGYVFRDANGLSDNLVNGTGLNRIESAPLYANLVQAGIVVGTSIVETNGYYAFLGLFTGTYEVQISTIQGTKGAAPPLQQLPATHAFVGENIGITAGSDGSPNGKLTVVIPVGGGDVLNVNFGIDAYPVSQNVLAPTQLNPGGTIKVSVPDLDISDLEDGVPSTVIINQIPNPVTEGLLYYSGILVTNNQVIPNFQSNLLEFDPIDGEVIIDFTYSTVDAAGLASNISTITMDFGTALPVELLHFRGAYANKEVQLYWKTATEINSDYFVIERSRDAVDFEELGQIDAAGNSTEDIDYSFVDEAPVSFFYYRLKQVDADEAFTYSNIIYIGRKKEILIDVYPTIVTDYLYVRNHDDDATLNIELVDNSGRVIKNSLLKGAGEIELDTENLPAGVYNIIVTDKNDNNRINKKIVKN